MESEQLFTRGYGRNSYNSITSASSDEELLDGAGVIMDFHTTEDDNLLDGDASPVEEGELFVDTGPEPYQFEPLAQTAVLTPASRSAFDDASEAGRMGPVSSIMAKLG
ncbi:unnamed protein product [Leuciscus chuanchicus]